MIVEAQAIALAEAHAAATGGHWDRGKDQSHGHYWYFAIGFMGSRGLIVDREDGRTTVLGSTHSVERCLWGHDRGFVPDDCTFRIVAVREWDLTRRFLARLLQGNPYAGIPARPVVHGADLPWDFGVVEGLWFRLSDFAEVEDAGWFGYEAGERRWVDTASMPASSGVAEWPFPDPVHDPEGRLRAGMRVRVRALATVPRKKRTTDLARTLEGQWEEGVLQQGVMFRFSVRLDRGGSTIVGCEDFEPLGEPDLGSR